MSESRYNFATMNTITRERCWLTRVFYITLIKVKKKRKKGLWTPQPQVLPGPRGQMAVLLTGLLGACRPGSGGAEAAGIWGVTARLAELCVPRGLHMVSEIPMSTTVPLPEASPWPVPRQRANRTNLLSWGIGTSEAEGLSSGWEWMTCPSVCRGRKQLGSGQKYRERAPRKWG